MKFLYSITIIVVIILVGCTMFVVPATTYLSIGIKVHFSNWYDQDRSCSITSKKCEEYFETIHHLPCYLVYGHSGFGTDDWTAHIWNIVMMDGVPHEFESTTLEFIVVSDSYEIQTMQEGFYVDGEKYEKSQKLDDWEELV